MGITDALDALKTKEDFRSFILSELEEGKDVFGLWNKYETPRFVDADDDPGDRLWKVHAALDDERKELLEDAIFDIILNPSDFFRSTTYGNPGTISEYVGKMLVFHLTWDNTSKPSIKALRPRFIKKAREWALKINDAIQQERWIQTENELIQRHLLELLCIFHNLALSAIKD